MRYNGKKHAFANVYDTVNLSGQQGRPIGNRVTQEFRRTFFVLVIVLSKPFISHVHLTKSDMGLD